MVRLLLGRTAVVCQSKTVAGVRAPTNSAATAPATAARIGLQLAGNGGGVQEALHERLPELTMPVLLLTGQLDEKYHRLAEWMQTRISRCRWVSVPDTGHTVHVEKPDAFVEVVWSFLQAWT